MGTTAVAEGPGTAAGGGWETGGPFGEVITASNCRAVRISTDTKSSCGRFGRFGAGIAASAAINSVWRTTEAGTPQGDVWLRSVRTVGLRKPIFPARFSA